jgi:hypothetical protein
MSSRTDLRTLTGTIARRNPAALTATLALVESVLEAADCAVPTERPPMAPPALDEARSVRYQLQRRIGAGGQAEVLLAVARGAD